MFSENKTMLHISVGANLGRALHYSESTPRLFGNDRQAFDKIWCHSKDQPIHYIQQ